MSLPSFAYSRLTKLAGLCLALILTSQNAHAFHLNLDKISTEKVSSTLSYDNLISSLPSLFVFHEKSAFDMISTIRNDYLTFYSYKNENLKATYAGGAYLLKYTNHW